MRKLTTIAVIKLPAISLALERPLRPGNSHISAISSRARVSSASFNSNRKHTMSTTATMRPHHPNCLQAAAPKYVKSLSNASPIAPYPRARVNRSVAKKREWRDLSFKERGGNKSHLLGASPVLEPAIGFAVDDKGIRYASPRLRQTVKYNNHGRITDHSAPAGLCRMVSRCYAARRHGRAG